MRVVGTDGRMDAAFVMPLSEHECARAEAWRAHRGDDHAPGKRV